MGKSVIHKSGGAKPVPQEQTIAGKQQFFQGHFKTEITPIPSPKTLNEYEAIHPGAIQWFLDRAEKEQTHRHNDRDRNAQMKDNFHRRDTNTVLYIIIIMYFCALAAIAIMTWIAFQLVKREAYGYATTVLTAVTGLVGVIIFNFKGKNNSKELPKNTD